MICHACTPLDEVADDEEPPGDLPYDGTQRELDANVLHGVGDPAPSGPHPSTLSSRVDGGRRIRVIGNDTRRW